MASSRGCLARRHGPNSTGIQVEARDSTYPSFKAALAHVAPVFLGRDATVDKCRALIAEAARYYNRFDIFKLTVNRSLNRPVAFEADDEAAVRAIADSPESPKDEEFEADPQVVRLRNER